MRMARSFSKSPSLDEKFCDTIPANLSFSKDQRKCRGTVRPRSNVEHISSQEGATQPPGLTLARASALLESNGTPANVVGSRAQPSVCAKAMAHWSSVPQQTIVEKRASACEEFRRGGLLPCV